MGVFDKLKAAAQSVSDKAKEWVDAGIDNVKEALEALIKAADDAELERVGYRLRDIELELSLTPRVVVFLNREREVADEAFTAVLEAHMDSTTLTTLIKALQQANAMDRRLRPNNRSMAGLRVELGVPPVLSLRYVGEERESSSESPLLQEHIEDY